MYEFYRESLIGKALQEAVEEKLNRKEITIAQARIILEKFDTCIPEVFSRIVQTTINFKGTVRNYNYVDGVWRFNTNNFKMTVNNEIVYADFVKIVACDADTTDDSGRKRKRKPNNG